ncbi:hypothetical protein HAT86_00140 [Roseovarius gahaiensis]|uniref:Uncharacterized protein n=1 Tax=Roseovarius gahaiensis TaxID=2716691 RepID=A0A967BB71_9RHOB|nr:hypothetical protein [Roseovarius gahaiensis]NHQ72876.1 hypothetical protein [Roseovarius gahaiensis]
MGHVTTKAKVALFAVFAMTSPAWALELGADRAGYHTANEQRAAILDCKYDLGRGGRAIFQAVWQEYPLAGNSVLKILPRGGVSNADAAWINDCADKKLGRLQGQVGAKPREALRGNCPRNAPVIYGGATYCIKR